MRLEHWPQEKLEQELKQIIGKYIDLSEYKLFFFGSRVVGKSNERSDIDVGIEGAVSVPDNALARIHDDIQEYPILYKIDVVDFRRVSDKFCNIAKQSIEYFS